MRLEAEAQEEVRQALTKQREAKMKAMRDAQPKQPVEISVIAGDGKQVRIQLGGDTQEDSRKQVAEAAGLKHVPLPDFDDNNAAWAGSLKKTPKSKMMPGRGEEEMDNHGELHGWEHSDMLFMTTRWSRTMELISSRARDTLMRMLAIPMSLLEAVSPSLPSP